MKSFVKLITSLVGSAAGGGLTAAVISIGKLDGMTRGGKLTLLAVLFLTLGAIGGAWLGLLWGRVITKE